MTAASMSRWTIAAYLKALSQKPTKKELVQQRVKWIQNCNFLRYDVRYSNELASEIFTYYVLITVLKMITYIK